MKRILVLTVGFLAACLFGGASARDLDGRYADSPLRGGSTVSLVAMVYAVRSQTAKSWLTPIGNPRMGITVSALKTNGSTFPIAL